MNPEIPPSTSRALEEAPLLPLGAEFRFNAHDLQTNRHRRLTTRQSRRLSGRFLGTFFGGVFLMAAPVALALGLLMWIEGQGLGQSLGDSRLTLAYLVAGILGLFYALANGQTLLIPWDLWWGRVASVRGTGQLWGSYLVIGGKYRFVVDERARAAIQPALIYRVYLLPASKILLSLEYAE
jgi:hypothetical protein